MVTDKRLIASITDKTGPDSKQRHRFLTSVYIGFGFRPESASLAQMIQMGQMGQGEVQWDILESDSVRLLTRSAQLFSYCQLLIVNNELTLVSYLIGK